MGETGVAEGISGGYLAVCLNSGCLQCILSSSHGERSVLMESFSSCTGVKRTLTELAIGSNFDQDLRSAISDLVNSAHAIAPCFRVML